MDMSRIEKLNGYFDEEIAKCNAKGAELTEDNRKDEAVFAVIRGNILDIFRTISSVAQETCGGDEEKFREFFLSKTEQIPQNWRISLERARSYGDAEAAHVERVKIQAIEEIKDVFTQIWGEAE